jgi:hypothetical protein
MTHATCAIDCLVMDHMDSYQTAVAGKGSQAPGDREAKVVCRQRF